MRYQNIGRNAVVSLSEYLKKEAQRQRQATTTIINHENANEEFGFETKDSLAAVASGGKAPIGCHQKSCWGYHCNRLLELE